MATADEEEMKKEENLVVVPHDRVVAVRVWYSSGVENVIFSCFNHIAQITRMSLVSLTHTKIIT